MKKGLLKFTKFLERGIKNWPISRKVYHFECNILSKTVSKFGDLGDTYPPKTYLSTLSPAGVQDSFIALDE